MGAAAAVAAALVAAHGALTSAAQKWDGRDAVPRGLARPVLVEQKLGYRLVDSPSFARRVFARLPPRVARDVRDDVLALRELSRLTRPRPRSALRVCRARPAAALLSYYREAQRRFRVRWQLLAAINFVESDFGRLCNDSPAGAQGPMQFLRSTWKKYGIGDVHDPHDAILGAARYLVAAGVRSSESRALYRYNPSAAYVDAITRFARRIQRGQHVLFVYYSRQLFVRTPAGRVQLTHIGGA